MRRHALITTMGLTAFLVLGGRVSSAHAAPGIVPVQGYLTDPDGAPIDGSHRVTFQLFDSAEGGEALFTEDYSSLDVAEGYFVVYLGAQDTVLPLELFRDHQELWLQVIIDATEVIAPRTALGSVPFAAQAQYCGDATTLGGNPPAFYAVASSFDSHASDAAAHHSRYTDSEARAALSGHVNDTSAHHSRYSNAEAVNAVSGRGVVVTSCSRTGYVNGWDGVMNYRCPPGQVMGGMYSVHDNNREDRRFRFDCCSLAVQ